MNNDIRHNLNSYVNAQGGVNYSLTTPEKISANENIMQLNPASADSMADSMNILSAQGHAQVNMDNPLYRGIKDSMEQLRKNPQLVESYIYFCDSLMEEGLALEQAIQYTDMVFDALKKESM